MNPPPLICKDCNHPLILPVHGVDRWLGWCDQCDKISTGLEPTTKETIRP